MTNRRTARTPLLDTLLPLLAAYRPGCRQARTFMRLRVLTLGLLCALGRHTLSQVLVGLGVGDQPWNGWYRLFSRSRIGMEQVQQQFLAQVLTDVPATDPFTVVLDATQLPRTGKRMPGVGWGRCPRTPVWRPGIQRSQRWVGLNALLPRTPEGWSRALPLRWIPAPTPTATPLAGWPPQREWEAGRSLLDWLRARLDQVGRADQTILAVADGSYATARLWATLPERTILLTRCARNRALFGLPAPPDHPQRGRRRCYGERGATPAAVLGARTGWRQSACQVRGRTIPLTYQVSGPWLVRGAPGKPLWLLVVHGIKHGKGVTYRQRDPQFFLVNTDPTAPGTVFDAATLLAWAWHRWEVEVMHRELKSTFGLGQAQAWTPTGTVLTTQWLTWSYALLVLTGFRAWGLGPGPLPVAGRWGRPRRWSLGTLWQGYRHELWRLGEFQPVWTRSPDPWTEMERWLGTRTNALLGMRHL